MPHATLKTILVKSSLRFSCGFDEYLRSSCAISEYEPADDVSGRFSSDSALRSGAEGSYGALSDRSNLLTRTARRGPTETVRVSGDADAAVAGEGHCGMFGNALIVFVVAFLKFGNPKRSVELDHGLWARLRRATCPHGTEVRTADPLRSALQALDSLAMRSRFDAPTYAALAGGGSRDAEKVEASDPVVAGGQQPLRRRHHGARPLRSDHPAAPGVGRGIGKWPEQSRSLRRREGTLLQRQIDGVERK